MAPNSAGNISFISTLSAVSLPVRDICAPVSNRQNISFPFILAFILNHSSHILSYPAAISATLISFSGSGFLIFRRFLIIVNRISFMKNSSRNSIVLVHSR
ncbi:unnamed protein product [Meloidogyne enterolobii]|uniref:Uncharacterized protein n=1 Tax=Meloidogyne enterolobii TaxID=390850 RepID=A0ACB0YS94_MELEN